MIYFLDMYMKGKPQLGRARRLSSTDLESLKSAAETIMIKDEETKRQYNNTQEYYYIIIGYLDYSKQSKLKQEAMVQFTCDNVLDGSPTEMWAYSKNNLDKWTNVLQGEEANES